MGFFEHRPRLQSYKSEGGNGGGIPPQPPISYLVTYKLFETLIYCVSPPSTQSHTHLCLQCSQISAALVNSFALMNATIYPTKTTPICEARKWRIAGAGTQNLRHWGQIWRRRGGARWRRGGARLRRAAQGRRRGSAGRRRGGAGAAPGGAGAAQGLHIGPCHNHTEIGMGPSRGSAHWLPARSQKSRLGKTHGSDSGSRAKKY